VDFNNVQQGGNTIMLEKAKKIIKNQEGMETMEVIGMGVVGLIAVALLFNAVKPGFNSTTNKVGNGLTTINSMGTSTSTITP